MNIPNELMNTRIENKDSYTKDDIHGLAGLCDWFLHARSLIKLRDTENPKTIFLSAINGFTSVPYFLYSLLPNLKEKIIVILASEDATFPYGTGDIRSNYYIDSQKEIKLLFQASLVERIFVENLDTRSYEQVNCYPIPLGFLYYNGEKNCNSLAREYTLLLESNINNEERSIKLFVCHNIRQGPQWIKRRRTVDLAQNEWKDFCYYRVKMEEREFMQTLQKSKFTVCAQGGGYDPCPKAWQAILCGCIPIIEHSPLDWAFERLPVVFVNSWQKETISIELLDKWEKDLSPYYIDLNKRKEVLNMLTLKYWFINVICNFEKHKSIAIKHIPENMQFIYKSTALQKDVTGLCYDLFYKNGEIKISCKEDFNELFGDIHRYVEKVLSIQIGSKRYELKETRTIDFILQI